jgi:hypothetical protein
MTEFGISTKIEKSGVGAADKLVRQHKDHHEEEEGLVYNTEMAAQLRSDPLNLKMSERSGESQINDGVLAVYNFARESGVETKLDCYVEMLDKLITETEGPMLRFNSIFALAAIGTQAAHNVLTRRLEEAPSETQQGHLTDEFMRQFMTVQYIADAATAFSTKSTPLLDSLIKAWSNWKEQEPLSSQISEAIQAVASADRERFQDLDRGKNEIGSYENICLVSKNKRVLGNEIGHDETIAVNNQESLIKEHFRFTDHSGLKSACTYYVYSGAGGDKDLIISFDDRSYGSDPSNEIEALAMYLMVKLELDPTKVNLYEYCSFRSGTTGSGINKPANLKRVTFDFDSRNGLSNPMWEKVDNSRDFLERRGVQI